MSNPWQIQTTQFDKTNKEGNVDTTGYGQISILLDNYVRKEKGKALSSNDFTDTHLQKLNTVEVGAQENKIEKITLNHTQTIYPDENKTLYLNLPTKISDLANDSAFAKLANVSQYTDYQDSYVGKAKYAFQEEENIAIGKNADASSGGIAIGANCLTSEEYDINIGNKLKHNANTDIFEIKVSTAHSADVATSNSNGTNLNNLDTVISNLQTEVTNRTNADTTLRNTLTSVTSRVSTIEGKIPSQASTTNQLADKSFVNSSIQTSTANFRGSWDTWVDVPSDSTQYPPDGSGSTTPTINDYMVVLDASGYGDETLKGTWRFKYTGTWTTNGKNGWVEEYQVNEEPFTSEQNYAINSGITSEKVSDYDAHLINENNPHSVTASQVGLGNVTNVSTIATVTQDSTSNITSGAVYTALEGKMNADVTHLSGDVPTSRSVNGYDLTQDITLDASDVGALPNDQANTLLTDGYVTAPTALNPNKVWKTDASGNPDWRNESSVDATFLNNPIICSTASATADKTVTYSGFVLHKHCRCIIDFENTNTAESELTLNINSTGAKTIILNGVITSATNFNLTSGLYNAYYDGTYWVLDNEYDSYKARSCGTIVGHTLYL